MFVNDSYTLRVLSEKLGVPDAELEQGLRRVGAQPVRDRRGRSLFTYEAVWEFVHRRLNHQHFAAWGRTEDTLSASELTAELMEEITGNWPGAARLRLADIVNATDGSTEVRLVRRPIRRIDPECPACGYFPWIVGFDDRQVAKGMVLSIYVCPGCGYLFLKR